MTVCVAIKVHDCIVFAADSASSLIITSENGVSSVMNVWGHGLKVFNLHKELPIVAMTSGMGHCGPASVSDLAKDLRITFNALDKSTYTIQDVVEKAEKFFYSKYVEITPPPTDHGFEFWVGGYGAQGARGEIWKFAIQNQERSGPEKIVSAEDDQSVIWGRPTASN